MKESNNPGGGVSVFTLSTSSISAVFELGTRKKKRGGAGTKPESEGEGGGVHGFLLGRRYHLTKP